MYRPQVNGRSARTLTSEGKVRMYDFYGEARGAYGSGNTGLPQAFSGKKTQNNQKSIFGAKNKSSVTDIRRMLARDDRNGQTQVANSWGQDSIVTSTLSYSESLRNQRQQTKNTTLALKKLKYQFKSISSKILRSKTSQAAKQAAGQARREIMRLKRQKQNSDSDSEEIDAAIAHAQAMERVAKKKAKHLEEEEMVKAAGGICPGDRICEEETKDVQDAEAENAQNAEDTESTERFVSYTVTQDELTDEVLAKVVASCGDRDLTNRDLAFYYWQQYYTFVNNYGSYLSYIMDTSKGLDEQAYSEDQTWQQAFLDSAVTMFHSMTAINLEADKAGFELGEEDQAQLDAIPESLDATAGYYGMEDGLAYLQRVFGPSVTVEDYVAFVRDSMRASRYMELLVEQMEFSDAEISDYYDQHAEDYAQSRIEKIDKPMVSVRHILVIPTEQNEDGTYTDEAWAEAEQKAQALLDEWKAGEATEDSFAALANENSEDPGSSSNGGLYEDVYPGQMVDPFDEWCFDDARKPGDTGIVKTDYGYHVMYYASKGEAVFWFEAAKSDLQTERENALEESIREQYPLTETLENAAIFDVQAEDRAAANAAAAEAAASEAATEESGTDASEDTAAQKEAGE